MIEKQIQQLYKRHDSYNPYSIAKDRQIDILTVPLDLNTCGLTVRNNRFNTIVLNDKIEENLKEYTLCHELGHCILHQQASTPFMRNICSNTSISKMEAEAHRFAFALLRQQYEELDYMTHEQILDFYQLPQSMSRFIQ